MDVVLYNKIRKLESGPSFNQYEFNNVSPIGGATNVDALSFVMSSFDGNTHTNTNIQVSTTTNFTNPLVNITTPDPVSNYFLSNTTNINPSTTYYWRFRYKDSILGWSEFSTPTSFTTSSNFVIDGNYTIGTLLGGGYIAGIINESTIKYILIVSPKFGGERSAKQWKTTRSSTSGTDSEWNGWTNTNNMNNFSYHPAANWVRSIIVNGYDDWYLPAKTELGLLYSLHSSDVLPADDYFESYVQTTGFGTQVYSEYWSSTQYSDLSSYYQNFYNGSTNTNVKNAYNHVRAVRRIII